MGNTTEASVGRCSVRVRFLTLINNLRFECSYIVGTGFSLASICFIADQITVLAELVFNFFIQVKKPGWGGR